MPKDYRERRIDTDIPKLRTKNAAQAATAADPDKSGLGTGSEVIPLDLPIVTVNPDFGVLWFLRMSLGESAPSGRLVELQTIEGGAVTFDYVASPSGWSNYITSFAGDYEVTAGGTVIKNETVYVIWDQFTNFAAGTYKLNFTNAAGSIDRAILLHGVSTSSPGTFYAGMSQSPTWSKTYVSAAPAGITNNFPRTFTLGSAGTARAAYAIYQMSGTVQAPAALYSAPGLPMLTYTYTNPADPPTFNRTIVTFYGDTLPTTTTLEVVAPWENGWGGVV